MPEIKGRLDRITELGNSIGEQFTRLKGPEGEEAKKKAKELGARLGIGAGLSIFGLIIAAVALVYSLAVIILLVNIALDRLWLSALIVVGGFLIIGLAIIGAGVGIAKSSAKELSKTTEDVTKQVKLTIEQIRGEVEELQKLLKLEAEERQKQMAEMMEKAKKAAPAVAPFAFGAYAGYRILKRAMTSHREKRAILKVIETYEKARAKA